MNEVMETIYQWHKGMKIQHISQSLGLDRKTVRKYVGMAGSWGATRYKTIKAMLEKEISDEQPRHRAPLSDLGQKFLRSPAYFSLGGEA